MSQIDFCINEEIDIKSENLDDPLQEHNNELHEEIYIKSEPFEEHDTEFDSNVAFGPNTTLSGNKMDTDNIEIGVEDVKPFEFVEVVSFLKDSLLAEPVTDNSIKQEKSNEDFSSCENLQQNVLKFNDKDIHQCLICSVTFTSQLSLNSHLLYSHTEIRPFTCPICIQNFKQKGYLKIHLLTIHNLDENSVDSFVQAPVMNLYICKTCDHKFKTIKNLKKHVKTVHNSLKCDICGARYTNQKSLNSHLTIHSGDNPYKCSICSKDFRLKNVFLQHMTKIHEIGIAGFVHPTVPIVIDQETNTVCELCNAQFSSFENLEEHKISFHSIKSSISSATSTPESILKSLLKKN